MAQNNTKKRLVTSFNNLTTEQQDEVKALYPRGYAEVMTRIDKPNGDFFYVVPYETEEISYLVKIDVKIDDATDEGMDDDFYGDDQDEEYDEDEVYEVECPNCHDIIYLDEGMLEEEEMNCPNCGTRLEFEFECDCGCEGECDCDCEE